MLREKNAHVLRVGKGQDRRGVEVERKKRFSFWDVASAERSLPTGRVGPARLSCVRAPRGGGLVIAGGPRRAGSIGLLGNRSCCWCWVRVGPGSLALTRPFGCRVLLFDGTG